MDNRQAYNTWASSYDTVANKTRDLEAHALHVVLNAFTFKRGLEIGCGTGKNTERLVGKCDRLIAVDFSEEMLTHAKSKIKSDNIQFIQADVTKQWNFIGEPVNLVTCSLILEHIENLNHIFHQAAESLSPNGLFYICELHPFKQYAGSKARFETTNGIFELQCFTHHVSDYFSSALRHGFMCEDLQEWFDDHDRTATPRLISFLFRKPS